MKNEAMHKKYKKQRVKLNFFRVARKGLWCKVAVQQIIIYLTSFYLKTSTSFATQYFSFLIPQNSVHCLRSLFVSRLPIWRTQTILILKMRRILYNFYTKISKSRGLNFANFGGRVEPHTVSTQKFLLFPQFGKPKGPNLKRRVEPYTFYTQKFLWDPSFGKLRTIFFMYYQIYISIRRQDRSITIYSHRKNRGPYGQ